MDQSAATRVVYRFDPFTLDLDRLALSRDGKVVDLRPKAFDTLRLLVERSGQLVSKDELVAAIWPNVTVNDDSLAQCVRDVRKALGDHQHYIKTAPRRGYMFVATVERASLADADEAPLPRAHRRLAAILAADVVGYSRLVGVDEVGTLERLRAIRANLIDAKISEYRGRIVKEMGDGFLAEFGSVVDAVQCAADIQASLAGMPATGDTDIDIAFRIGINLGDVIVEGDDLFGDGVNVAARLEGLAVPGGICISASAYEQVRQRLKLGFEDIGPQALKNIAEPIHAYRLAAETPPTAPANRRGTRRWLMPALGLVLILAIAGAGFIWWRDTMPAAGEGGTSVTAETDAAPAAVQARRLNIAVLPFETSSETTEDRWLGEGIAEDIMTELSRFRDIGVIARNSSFRYGSQPAAMRELRDDLGADFVLQGSTRLLGDRIRLALQLVDTETETNIWAEQYDRPYEDVLSVKADIISQISARLFTEAYDTAGARISGRDPQSLDAFELLLRARWAYYKFTRESAVDGLALAERAVEIDPEYAAAWELLSRLRFQFYIQPYDQRRGDPEALEQTIAAARRAVALDPRNSTAVATLGNSHAWAGDYAIGLEELRRAIELNPSDATAVRMYADSLSRAGHQEESLAAWAEGKRLDPVIIPLNQGLIARSHIFLGEYETAFALTTDCLQRSPKLLPCHLMHIAAALALGREEDFQASVAAVRELAPRFTVSDWRRIAKFGNPAEAETLSNYLLKAGLSP